MQRVYRAEACLCCLVLFTSGGLVLKVHLNHETTNEMLKVKYQTIVFVNIS